MGPYSSVLNKGNHCDRLPMITACHLWWCRGAPCRKVRGVSKDQLPGLYTPRSVCISRQRAGPQRILPVSDAQQKYTTGRCSKYGRRLDQGWDSGKKKQKGVGRKSSTFCLPKREPFLTGEDLEMKHALWKRTRLFERGRKASEARFSHSQPFL